MLKTDMAQLHKWVDALVVTLPIDKTLEYYKAQKLALDSMTLQHPYAKVNQSIASSVLGIFIFGLSHNFY